VEKFISTTKKAMEERLFGEGFSILLARGRWFSKEDCKDISEIKNKSI